MSTISVRLPDSVHKKLKELAKLDNVSLNQFINSALSEKIAAFITSSYLEERAKKASRKKYKKVLSKVSKKTPRLGDEL
ncbi:MAG: toxin-antitoxin system HicB family antitoxin [Candidatus Dadabacteria bacterium]|nr:toxin-antitoxin system HicB family antitoxin [Candidatus Dadabacteria bacterium]NIS09409.1 toxin-antitoxin system HicB family antitoxin [Candidatus Dadabacteria bacterium]NIV42546.1 toxin-antitoxin system HicB family antitoxin [Candidatus Dadabacteria bacterium]NIY22647.1 toxin-antitoxin system HicB family antitoxin [Candidatus Dadabacteria bacterium]